MARPDFHAACLPLPPLKESEVRSFVGCRLSDLYPGPAQNAVFDYALWRSGGRRYALVFVTDGAVLARYRIAACGRPLLLPFPLMRRALERYEGEDGVALFWQPEWVEVLLCAEGGAIDSVVVERSSGSPLARIEALLPSGFAPRFWLHFCGPAEKDSVAALAPSVLRPDCSVEVVEIDRGLERRGGRSLALFEARETRHRVPASVRLQGLVLLLLAASALALEKDLARERRQAQELQASLQDLERRTAGLAALETEVETLRRDLAELERRAPTDVYSVLCELSSVLAGEATLRSLLLEGSGFQLEGTGRDPLRLMERFGGSPLFSEVKLVQTVPAAGGESLFKLTGRLHAQ